MKAIYSLITGFLLISSCTNSDENNSVCSAFAWALSITVTDSLGRVIFPDSIVSTFENEQPEKEAYGSYPSIAIGVRPGDYRVSIWENDRDTVLHYSVGETGDENCRLPDTQRDTIQFK